MNHFCDPYILPALKFNTFSTSGCYGKSGPAKKTPEWVNQATQSRAGFIYTSIELFSVQMEMLNQINSAVTTK